LPSHQKFTTPACGKARRPQLLLVIAAVVISGGLVAWSEWRRSRVVTSDPPLPLAPPITKPETAADTDEPPTGKFEPTVVNDAAAPGEAPPGMVWIPGGEFSMGCDDPRGCVCGGNDPMPDARPIHRVYVDGFWMDVTEVTNEQFAKFVEATGYVTIAEQKPKQEDFPDAPPENLVPGSTVFVPTIIWRRCSRSGTKCMWAHGTKSMLRPPV
jgi:formylglycine-generating enzyme required for sulfatase activity